MIETYFSRTSTINRLRSGPLDSDLDDLTTTLHQQGYAQDSIQRYVRGCDHFGRWLFQQGYTISDVNETLTLLANSQYRSSTSHHRTPYDVLG